MEKIEGRLFVGWDGDCFHDEKPDWAVVHACKTCHTRALGYPRSLPSSHPGYLFFERGKHLFLNILDIDRLQQRYTNPIVKQFIVFMEKNKEMNILIHCNQALSRSPALALIYLARQKRINDGSYDHAVNDFNKRYATYYPGRGISSYLQKHWQELMRF